MPEISTRGDYYSASQIYRKLYTESRDKDNAIRGVIAFEMAEVYRKLNRSPLALNAYKTQYDMSTPIVQST